MPFLKASKGRTLSAISRLNKAIESKNEQKTVFYLERLGMPKEKAEDLAYKTLNKLEQTATLTQKIN